jgi:hypothetical protein
MLKSSLFCVALFSIGLFGAALLIGANNPLAAGNCITNSYVPPPKGTRWFYRVDPATNRKCLHLVAVAANAPRAQHAAVRPTNRKRLHLTNSAPRAQHAAVRPTSIQIGQRSNQLGEAEQAALFQQFLRWKEQQTAANINAAEPSR